MELKPKVRDLEVRLTDGSIHTVAIDQSAVVGLVVAEICASLSLSGHEEYSLSLEDEADAGKAAAQHKDARRLAKMQAKLQTEDDRRWLDHSRTLSEQGISSQTALSLRKKFFSSDDFELDKSDEAKVNLLYHQSRDAILDGTHPVTQDEAMTVSYGCSDAH